MPRMRSLPNSGKKQPKPQKSSVVESVNAVEKQEKPPEVPTAVADEKQPAVQNAPADASMDVYDKRKADRDRKLALRQQDKDFLIETAKIKARLLELQKSNPKLFESLFRRGSYLAAYRPDRIAEWMAEATDDYQKQILKDFWFYTARFRVWLGWDFREKGFKKASAFPPHATKYRARLVKGRLELMAPPAPELAYETEYEDGNLSVPDAAVEKWLAGGRTKFVLLEDVKGHSILNELESFAYDPNAVTLIVHGSVMPYLFLLVGELATVGDVRDAAKVLTALQKRFYGRSRAGRPKDTVKYRQVLEKLQQRDGKSQIEKAFDLLPPDASSKKLRSSEVKLSKARKAIKS